MDKHEYMIWRAATRYNLLHDKDSGATEASVEEMIDEKERKITELIPNYFEGKNNYDESEDDLKEKGVCLKKCRKLKYTGYFIISRDDRTKWGNMELLCYLSGDTSYHYAPFKWHRYPVMSYDEAISVIYDHDFGEDFIKPNINDFKAIKECLPKLGLYTKHQAEIISLFHSTRYQITPNGEKVTACLFLGNDFLEEIKFEDE